VSELLKINVNDHTERKNGLTYLSWAWAWAEVLKLDPAATWEAQEFNGLPCIVMPDTTCMVKVSVTIKGDRKTCLLPVMNHRNQAIKNPDAFAVNTALMRCLAKAIAMHGLGLYIYAGEDLPEADEKPVEKPTDKPAQVKPINPGVISATDGAADALQEQERNEMTEVALYLIDCHRNERDMEAIRVWYDPATFESNEQRVFVWSLLKTESKLRALLKANNPNNLKEAA
jgi:hypothetical protein